MTWLLAFECFALVHLLDLKSPSLFHYMLLMPYTSVPFGEDPCRLINQVNSHQR
jgi:hypothetical protein